MYRKIFYTIIFITVVDGSRYRSNSGFSTYMRRISTYPFFYINIIISLFFYSNYFN